MKRWLEENRVRVFYLALALFMGNLVVSAFCGNVQRAKALTLTDQEDEEVIVQDEVSLPKPASLSPVFTPEVKYWEAEIFGWAASFGLDPNLVATVMQIESCGNPRAVSQSGALGLFQVMPYHFHAGEDPLNPQVNASRGLLYLKRAWQLAEGDLWLTFAGYNGGHSVIEWDPVLWPEETKDYAIWGAGIMGDIKKGLTKSPTLDAWLTAGGFGLCREAAKELDLP